MIIVILCQSKNEKTGRMETLVSHGVNVDTGENVTLPWVPVSEIGATYNEEMGEYVLKQVN